MLCRICHSRLKFKYAANNSRGENGNVFYCKKCDAFFVEESEFDYRCHDVVKYYEDHEIYIKNRYEKFFLLLSDLFRRQVFWILDRGWDIRWK